MRYARAAWKQERASWRAVIQLNIIRSVNTILDALEGEMDDPTSDNLSEDTCYERDPETQHASPLTEKHQLLRHRLGSLKRVEMDLKYRLSAEAEEESAGIDTEVLDGREPSHTGRQEFYVRRWRSAFPRPGTLVKALRRSVGGTEQSEKEATDEATNLIASRREDMEALWADEAVRAVLNKRKMRLEDSAGL